jgi:hypothetical protein
LLDDLADRIAERVSLRRAEPPHDQWLTTREAAQHLGIHPDNLRKLATARAIPSEQEAPGCARYFRLSVLDSWRASGSPRRSAVRSMASTQLPRDQKAA